MFYGNCLEIINTYKFLSSRFSLSSQKQQNFTSSLHNLVSQIPTCNFPHNIQFQPSISFIKYKSKSMCFHSHFTSLQLTTVDGIHSHDNDNIIKTSAKSAKHPRKMSRNIAKESLGTVLNILRVLWIYPTESVKIPPKVWKFCTWTVHLFFVVVPLSLTVIYTITEKITDVQSISDTIFITSEIFADIIKYIPLRLYPNRYKELVETLNSPMFNSYLKEQKYYMDETVKFIRKISFFIMVQIGISLGTAILNPLFVDAPKFVIPLWIPSAIEENKLAYLLFAGYIYCFLFYTAIGHSAIDILIPAMYSHAATQLRILKDTLEHLGRRTKEKCAKRVDLSSEERRELEKKILYSEICYCVEHYEAIAQFVKALESGFMGIVLPQVVVSVLTICLTAFHLSFVSI